MVRRMLNPFDGRNNVFEAYIGTNTVGKTPTMVNNAKAWKAPRPTPPYTLRGLDPRRSFTQAGLLLPEYKIKLEDKKTWAKELSRKNADDTHVYRNILLVLDDYKWLCDGDDTPEDVLNLMQAREDMNMDIMIACHAPMLITERLSYYITDYYIFYNKASLASFNKKINNSAMCQEAAVMVNEYVTKFGRGKYPYFPHIHINPEKNLFETINMEASKLKQLDCFSV